MLTADPSATPTAAPSGTFTPPPTGLPTSSSTSTGTPIPSETPLPRVYVFPVQPARDSSFNDGVGHPYPATDIFAPFGDRFVAVTDGVVDFVSFQDQWDADKPDPATHGGLSVAIVGDDGVRYYGSHLSAIAPGIAPGRRVKAGQLLGLVGDSGDAAGKLAHVHFGISPPTFPTDWRTRRGMLDPYAYLLAWKHGASVTPVLANLTPTP